MKKILLIFLFLNVLFCFSQTNQELIESLKEDDFVQLDYTNMSNKFGILLDQISDKELFELTKDKNPTIRTYAKIGIIDKGKGNILNLLEDELKKNVPITVLMPCNGEYDTTAAVVYQSYVIKKVLDTLYSFPKKDYFYVENIVLKNKIFKQLDSLIIYSNCDLNYRVLGNTFARKHDNHLLRIEKLAFEMNIFNAFYHLMNNYEKTYKKKEFKYFTKVFPKQKFKTNNEVMSLINYLIYLLESDNKTLYRIGIKRLKKQEWGNHEYNFLLEGLIEEKGIKI